MRGSVGEGGEERECEGGGLTTWLPSALSSPARLVQPGQPPSAVRRAPSCRISQRGHRHARARREIYESWRASLE